MDSDKTIILPRPGGRLVLPDDADDRTIIRPRPGGERAAIAAANSDATVLRPRRAGVDGTFVLGQAPGFGRNALLDAAATLLSLAAQLVQVQGRIDVDRLHVQAAQQVRNFQREAATVGIDQVVIQEAGYMLCALVDETVLNTHWGEHSAWSQKTLLGQFYQQTSGGERVFSMIEEALGAVRKDYQLLELAFVCLSLGFEGKHRVDPRGAAALERIRSDIYQVLQESRDRYRRDLSPAAQPARHIRHRLHSFLPVWVAAAVLGLLVFVLFSYLQIDLNKRSDQLQATLAELVPPAERFQLAEQPTLAPHPVDAYSFEQALAAEIEQGVLRLESYPNRASIVLDAGELFASGRADVNEAYHPVLAKIAKVCEGVPGRIVVSGHTDSAPIRTRQFPSNWHLSLARASAVVEHLAKHTGLSGRLLPEGRADTEPIADNGSATGRARNRRVVIDVYVRQT